MSTIDTDTGIGRGTATTASSKHSATSSRTNVSEYVSGHVTILS